MLEFFDMLGPWTWVIAGLALVGLEMMAPGVFFIWLGVAALATGLADWALDLSWQVASLAFAALAIVAVIVGRMVSRSASTQQPGPGLNRRGEALIGQIFLLDAPIVGGQGRLRVDDSFWRVTGPDAPAGTTMRVTRIDGATLVVERI